MVLTKEQHREVLASLLFSKQDGGRALQSDLPDLGLEKGDLLEATPTLLDIGDALDRLFLESEEPREVLFWRKRYQTKLLHRVPICSAVLGIGISSIAIDVLHCVHLGVMQRFCMAFLWMGIEMNAWRIASRLVEEVRDGSCLVINESLSHFYRAYARMHRDRPLSELNSLVGKMLGTRKKPKLKLKAAETWGFLLWIESELPKIGHKFGDRLVHIQAGVSSIIKWIRTIQSEGAQLSMGAQQVLCDCIIEHLQACQRLGIRFIPKHHMWIHLTTNSGRLGNPRLYWTFLDESLNGTLKQILRRCHQATFERRALGKFWLLFGCGKRKREADV